MWRVQMNDGQIQMREQRFHVARSFMEQPVGATAPREPAQQTGPEGQLCAGRFWTGALAEVIAPGLCEVKHSGLFPVYRTSWTIAWNLNNALFNWMNVLFYLE